MSNLFIGLGGFGANTLEFLSEKMSVYNDHLARQYQPQVSAHYYYIDTDEEMFRQNPEKFTYGSNKTFHALGHHSPYYTVEAMKRSENRQYEKWYGVLSQSSPMNCGSGCIRQYARLGFAAEANTIRQELTWLVQQVIPQNGRIYVITGSCGGTGSGIYMDILYMISEIYETLNCPTASADVRLIMAMPEGYLEQGDRSLCNIANVKMELNAFATLEELNAICKDKNSRPSKFNKCYIGNHKKHGCFQPFRFGYLYDIVGQSPREASQKLSEFLFELENAASPENGLCAAPGYNGSFFDTLMTNNVHGYWYNTINNDYVKAFNALGQYSIENPDFLYRTYFSNRLLYEVFHEGLVGKKEAVNADKVTTLANKFKTEKIDPQTENFVNTIMSSIVSILDFKDVFEATTMFSVFTLYPRSDVAMVHEIILQKDALLQKIKAEVYSQCKEWLGQYDFATVYTLFEQLDNGAYQEAVATNEVFADQLAKAKDNAKGGILKRIKPDKALKEFEILLHTWLAFEVNKALSSGVHVDITIQNRGFYDNCKAFIEKARHAFALAEENEHWDQFFVKKVGELKAKDDRSYIPDLNTFTNDQGRIVEDSDMVKIYDENVVVKTGEPDFMQGTCTPVSLHGKIIEAMKSNVNLVQEGIDMGEIFDPTPGKTNSLNSSSKTMLFVEKYVAAAKEQIGILLQANQSYQQLFAGDILTRLQNLPLCERAKICQSFACFDSVKLRTSYMNQHALTTCTYYLVSSTANVGLMQELGILDQNGNTPMNSAHSQPNPFFDDKIVKLIVKNGYKIDDYRYFEEYKEFAKQTQTTDRVIHNPFIDKRFLGEPDQDGEYPCDVSAALDKIANEVD